MSVPTVALNEGAPDGGDYKRQGDDEIRTHKTQVREIVGVDHKYDSSGQDADMGKHNKVSLLEKADLGTGAEGKPILGAQTVSGKAELVFTDEDDNDVQITSEGSLVGATAESIFAIIYPVGGLYISTLSTNPGTLLGIGTWIAFGEGRVLIGVGTSDAVYAAAATGGVSTHKLTSAESGVPIHTHPIDIKGNGTTPGNLISGTDSTPDPGSNPASNNNIAADAASAHTNLQPYEVVYIWKRTV